MTFRKFPIAGISFAMATIITGSLAADALKGEALFIEWFPVLKEYKILITTFSFILFALLFYFLYKHRKDFLAVKGLSQHLCEPHASLIILLSTPSLNIKLPKTFSFPLKLIDARKNKSVTLKGKSLKDDIETLNTIWWNWQQLLRGLEPHQSSLNNVYLIGSKDSGRIKGSFSFLDQASSLISQYFPSVSIQKTNSPVDFEDFNMLVKNINKTIQKFKEKGASEKDIIIDVTGGQKTTSIAGAVVTLNSQVTFQYVETNKPYDVWAYDVFIQSPIS